MSAPTASSFTATVLGSARIGPNRELKKATEAYWAGRLDRSGLESVAAQLRADTWSRQHTAGLDSIPVGTFSFYDHVLDTAVMLGAAGFDLGVGPGVYDIHSPRVPSEDEITALLRKALQAVPAERLWVNPDCGLKTRGTTEVAASLANLVAAAATVRAELNR
ncbi:hypothetical protein RBB84_15180 [Rhodococcus sp. D-6]|uniref:Cobalamin-independent methionine synthase MetE N-terminal domain-containing protein n=1 Tax=Rhodococcus sp. D-6 TaxID=1387842 RepID=A0AAU7USA9_9NOCA